MAGLGLTLDNIARVLGISPRLLDNWLKNPDINALYKKGQGRAEVDISKTLFELAKSGNVTAIIWYEKTRCGRSDRTEIKHSGDAESPVRIFLPDNGRPPYPESS